MKTNISLFMGLCVLIFANSAIAMNPKPYQELKEEFIAANDGQNPKNALAKAAVLKKCHNDPYYQNVQVWKEMHQARKTVNLLDKYEGKLLDTTVVLGAVALGLKFKKNINPAIAKGFLVAATGSLWATTACAGSSFHYLNKEYDINYQNAFDSEKKWLINELKSLKGLPSEHTTKLNKELEKTFQEKLAQKHS